LRRFLSVEDRTALRSLLKRPEQSGAKIEVLLKAGDGLQTPVQISFRPLHKNSSDLALFGIVVTDMTEAHRTRELLRALSHRVVEAQEAERGRVALELHDNITQQLCAIVFRFEALAGRLPDRAGPLRREAMKLHEMLGRTADEVERISRDLRPGVLEQLGLMEVVRATSTEFADRTGISTKLACGTLADRPPADTELAIYRILQEALKNVERHARARHVAVRLRQRGAFVELIVKDDGIGFDPEHHTVRRKGADGLGLLGVCERASYVGGTVKIKSARHGGTEVDVRIPLPTTPHTA
jgi:signal transduction histidine kinase